MLTSVSTPQRLRLGPYIPLGDALSLEEWSLHQSGSCCCVPATLQPQGCRLHTLVILSSGLGSAGSTPFRRLLHLVGGGCLVLPPWGLLQGLSRDLVAQSHPPPSCCRVPSAGFGGSGWVAWLQGLQPPGVSHRALLVSYKQISLGGLWVAYPLWSWWTKTPGGPGPGGLCSCGQTIPADGK